MSHKRWYCGLKDNTYELFSTAYTETANTTTHPQYAMIFGALKTKRAASFLVKTAAEELAFNRFVTGLSISDVEELAKREEDKMLHWRLKEPDDVTAAITAISLRHMMD